MTETQSDLAERFGLSRMTVSRILPEYEITTAGRIRSVSKDEAMAVKAKGGIDLTVDKTPLEVKNAGEGIKFTIDPAMLEQLQNAPGFVPVIVNIQPMNDLREFLGISS